MFPSVKITGRKGRAGFQRTANPNPSEVVPFGAYGAGSWTGHPIGLFIALGVILVGLIGIPEARLFFAGALVLGGGFGFFLWLLHR